MKVYLPFSEMSGFLGRWVAPLWTAESLRKDFTGYFFMRYADPEPHLRLRFFGPPRAVRGQPRKRVLSALNSAVGRKPKGGSDSPVWVSRYLPEFRRYGGETGVKLAERIFEASSDCALAFLTEALKFPEVEALAVAFALRSGEVLLASLGAGVRDRRSFFRSLLPGLEIALRRSGGLESARANSKSLSRLAERIIKGGRGPLDGRYEKMVLRLAKDLDRLGRSGKMRVEMPILGAILHMHYNRLGIHPPQEQRVLHLRAVAEV